MLSMSDPKLPDIQSISDALYLTPRTLQRRLVQEELSYREITEGLKKQICSFLIRHDPYSISSLTYILGYAEPASFIHSFKKWYGDSPQKVRRKLKETF
jgi:AraC-like DNA-binding protein